MAENIIDNPGHCPRCGGKVESFGTWPGYTKPDGTIQWMACMGCSSAIEFICTENCGWSYTWGHNPNNPRFAHEEERRPSWLEGECPV